MRLSVLLLAFRLILERIADCQELSVIRHTDGDIFTLEGSCREACTVLSSGTASPYSRSPATANLVPRNNSCTCQCNFGLPTFREDLHICVNDIHECNVAGFVSGTGQVERVPYVFLPQRGQIIYPHAEIRFEGVTTPVCGIAGAQQLTRGGWSELRNLSDSEPPFRLFRDEGRTFLQWIGEAGLREAAEGRVVTARLVCRDASPKSTVSGVFTPCVAFRVAGSPSKSNVREVLFSSTTQQSQGLSASEYTAIGLSSVILALIYVASVSLYLHSRKSKRKVAEEAEITLGSGHEIRGLVKNNPLLAASRHFESDTNSGLTESDVGDELQPSDAEQGFENVTSAIVHPQTIYIDQTEGFFASGTILGERLPEEDVRVVETADNHHQQDMPVLPGAQRRKLYFNPAYFDRQLLLAPPPAAIEFLLKIREVISIAKHKMAAKKFVPTLVGIPEEDTECDASSKHTAQNPLQNSRSFLTSSRSSATKSRKSQRCSGCPGCSDALRNLPTLTDHNHAHAGEIKVREWLENVKMSRRNFQESPKIFSRDLETEKNSPRRNFSQRESNITSKTWRENPAMLRSFENAARSDIYQNGGQSEVFQNDGQNELFQYGGQNEVFQNGGQSEIFDNRGQNGVFQNNRQNELLQYGDQSEVLKNRERNEVFQNGSQNDLFQYASKREVFQNGAHSEILENEDRYSVSRRSTKSLFDEPSQNYYKIDNFTKFNNGNDSINAKVREAIHRQFLKQIEENLALESNFSKKPKTPDSKNSSNLEAKSTLPDMIPSPINANSTAKRIMDAVIREMVCSKSQLPPPPALPTDYEVDSLERSKCSRKSSPESTSGSSPAQSTALPMDEELTMRNAVINSRTGEMTMSKLDQKSVEINLPELVSSEKLEAYSLVSEVYVNDGYDSPAGSEDSGPEIQYEVENPGHLTIKVQDSPSNYVRQDESEYEPDTLDRKPLRLRVNEEVIPNGGHPPAIYVDQTEIFVDSLERPVQILLRSRGSFRDDEMKNCNLKRGYGSLREIYEARLRNLEVGKERGGILGEEFWRKGGGEMEGEEERLGKAGNNRPDVVPMVGDGKESEGKVAKNGGDRRIDGVGDPAALYGTPVRDGMTNGAGNNHCCCRGDAGHGQPLGMGVLYHKTDICRSSDDLPRRSRSFEKCRNYSKSHEMPRPSKLNSRGRLSKSSDLKIPRRNCDSTTNLKKSSKIEDSGYLSSTDSNSSHKRLLPNAEVSSVSETDETESLADGASESGAESIGTDSVFFGNFQRISTASAILRKAENFGGDFGGDLGGKKNFSGDLMAAASDSEAESFITVMEPCRSKKNNFLS